MTTPKERHMYYLLINTVPPYNDEAQRKLDNIVTDTLKRRGYDVNLSADRWDSFGECRFLSEKELDPETIGQLKSIEGVEVFKKIGTIPNKGS